MAKFLCLHPVNDEPAYVVFINVEFIVSYFPTTVTVFDPTADDCEEEVEAAKVLISSPRPGNVPVDRTYIVSETAEKITKLIRGEL